MRAAAPRRVSLGVVVSTAASFVLAARRAAACRRRRAGGGVAGPTRAADKPRSPTVTHEEVRAAKVPLMWRDYCAHLVIPLNKCRAVRGRARVRAVALLA